MSEQRNGGTAEPILRYRMVFPPDDPESFAAYHGMMRPVFDIEVPRGGGATPFHSHVDSFVLDGMIVSNLHCSPLHFDRTHETILRGGLDEVMVVHYVEGQTSFFLDGTERRIEPGQIAIIDLTRQLRIAAGPFASVSLTISRRLFEARAMLPEEAHGAVLRDGPIASLLGSHLRTLGDPSVAIPQAEAGALASVSMDLVSACLRLWAGRQIDAAAGPVTLSAIRAAIEQQLGDPALGPSALMQQFGLSRAALYRLFDQRGGVTAYITERRLRLALRLVTDTSSSAPRVSELARRAGFTSASAFGRAFRDMFGFSPREARALAWRPIDPDDTPWRLPKITQRFVMPLDQARHGLVRRFVSGEGGGPEA